MAYDKTRLSDEEVQKFLAGAPGWSREGDELVRTYLFPQFRDAIAFVNRVADVAEKHNHHPDIDIRYVKVTLRLTTHDAGGLTFRDPKVATDADAVM